MAQSLALPKRMQAWLTLLRLGPTARGVLPFLLGAVIAWSQGNPINGAVLVISSLAVICIMEMTFLINDYYDYQADLLNKTFHFLSGGSRMLPSGLISKDSVLKAACAFIGVAVILGLILNFYYHTGPYTIPFGALAMFIGYFYTAKPFQCSYHGLGEISIWFACGWLATICGYYLQTGHLDLVTTLVSLPGATSVFLVILVNEIPDIPSDSLAGKRNLAVRLGVGRTIRLYDILLVVCYIMIVSLIFFGVPRISVFLSLILLPLIASSILSTRKSLESKTLQSLSLKTMAIDHLITIIYAVTFFIAGWNSNLASGIIIIGILFLLCFSMEGLSFISAKKLKEYIK
jgi:1,4-dihydroxy-2-naphthoate octaprenyltransferase